MKRSCAWAVVVVLLAGLPASAQTKAVLLDDYSVLEGTVQEIEGVVRVTPAAGAAKVVSAKQIAYVGESREKVYDFVAGKVDMTTADGSLRLAGWCEKVGLSARALTHAKAALAQAPTSAAARDAVTRLEKAKPRLDPAVKPAAVEPTLAQAPELPGDAGIAFAAKVQPVLLNQCATCHAAKGHAGPFKLTRIAEGYASPEATASNLKAAAAQLNRDRPTASPLLAYAATTHGGQKVAAFADKQRPAYQHLETWVMKALPATKPAPPVAKPDAEAVTLPGEVVGTTGRPVAAKPLAPPAPVAAPPAAAPPAKGNPRDPFDPARFNGQPRKADR